MLHANLAVKLRLRPITRQSSQNPVLTHTTTRAYAHANLALLKVSQKPVTFQDTANEITPI